MSVSGVSGTNNAVPLFDPGQASASQTNAGPANKNDNDNDNDTNDSAKVTAEGSDGSRNRKTRRQDGVSTATAASFLQNETQIPSARLAITAGLVSFSKFIAFSAMSLYSRVTRGRFIVTALDLWARHHAGLLASSGCRAQGRGGLAAAASLGRTRRRFFVCSAMPAPARPRLPSTLRQDVDGKVAFAAFTGKAALVMRAKGCDGASTIHSLIYRARESGEEMPSFDLWDDAPASKAKLIIIDECSMVDEELGRDLKSFGVPLLVLGDPAQLPPISGGGFFTEAEPDVMLTEVHRQARDNPIIRLSMDVREGKRISPGDTRGIRNASRHARRSRSGSA